MQFGGSGAKQQGEQAHVHWDDGGAEAIPALRVGRRPSFSQPAPAQPLPASRRVARADGGVLHQQDSRDWDTGEAAPVRPAARRVAQQS